MKGKEFLNDILTTYFRVVTFITIATLILGGYLQPSESFGYEAFAAPLFYGACGVLTNMVMYAKRELSTREILIRKAIQLVLLEAIILGIAFGSRGIRKEEIGLVLGMAISIFVIYLLAHLFDWIQNYLTAKKMTEELLTFQQSHKE